MKVLFLAYPQYADFEIGHVLFLLRKVGKAEIVTVTVNGLPVESIGGLKVHAETKLTEIKVNEFDLILISGGDGIGEMIDEESVSQVLQAAVKQSIPIASICASAVLLGKAGLLKGKSFTCLAHTYERNHHLFEGATYTGENILVENNIITAKGTAFAEFATATCQLLDLFPTKDQYHSWLNFCRGNN
ncbi:4-methyl-5(b-hydroxyethyl)-thiazole monophosphate biosynthesis [Cytobacillus purgationiresistens]|uniref:4-methyl-5(B-hydroxyethyl)-thiazole monophosphate biosynthesis n=1 Tax=Cytobacillus purgationiresistens TaxID=863449 RepID=A0ABU0AJF3_9BACI|nr:4-methyl-5(b-hydroxyethyl)-thiazole monophosphate biosynthesis [Cytobacillus purgationiresistens]